MMATKNLLVELFVEELPPKALKKLGEAFAAVLADSLKFQGLAPADAVVTYFASPRRLAVHVTAVAEQSGAKQMTVKLMPKKVGLTEAGDKTDALRKRLDKEGYVYDDHTMQLVEVEEKGVHHLVLRKQESPLPLGVALQQALGIAIAKLPIPKVMTYQLESGCDLPGWSSVSFVRPAHSLIALHGADVVPIQEIKRHLLIWEVLPKLILLRM